MCILGLHIKVRNKDSLLCAYVKTKIENYQSGVDEKVMRKSCDVAYCQKFTLQLRVK